MINTIYLFILFYTIDNPLICSCDLTWFPRLLQDLKNRDDEMTQKKRPMCTMSNEHREYFVQSMPLERMNCIGKKMLVGTRLNGATRHWDSVSSLLSSAFMLSFYSIINYLV